MEDFDLVTVKNKEYYTYIYTGRLNDVKEVSVVLSYPKDSFQEYGSLRTFISLETSLTTLEILNLYTLRWVIEPFFRDCKRSLGLKSYQIRSKKSVSRYLVIMIVAYSYCKLCLSSFFDFCQGLKFAQEKSVKSRVLWIFEAALSGKSINEVLKTLKVS